jgi:N-acetylmuramoyl-L-alanine amidase
MKEAMKKRVKRVSAALLLAALVLGGVLTAALDGDVPPEFPSGDTEVLSAIDAARRVTVLVSGGASPQAFYGENRGGVAYVRVREFADALGAVSTTVDDAITVTTDGAGITLKPGDKYLKAGGHYIYINGDVFIKGGDVYAPVRAIAEALGAQVGWSGEFRTALIEAGRAADETPATYTEEDLKWLAQIITAEARGESFEGKLAVGNVVMNRVASPGFPDSVYGVIFDRASGVQFTPAYSGAINNTPPEECVAAAEISLRGGADIVGDSLYFASTTKCWAARNRDLYGSVGAHYFYI